MKSWKYLTLVIILIVLVACGKSVEDAEDYTSLIEDITIPDDVSIVGLGEATHGNAEFQALKKDVFEVLVEKEDIRTFVIEGDFGGAQIVNTYISGDGGTAEEAINALDFGIYKTEQMIDLLEWMHDYNESVEIEEQISFYGNDMQRYDESKANLLAYFELVDHEAAQNYEEKLKTATNENLHDLTEDELEALDESISEIKDDLETNEDDYVGALSPGMHEMALQQVNVLGQRVDLSLHEDEYANRRDEYLAENLAWIMDHVEPQGRDKVFVSGHNGHIDKTSSAFGYKAMGDHLDEKYGDAYFAIGTESVRNTFLSDNGSGERETYTVKNNSPLMKAFNEVEEDMFYVDFDRASEKDELAELISSKQKMTNVGDDFRSWYKYLPFFYTIKMVPDESFDGMIIVKEAHPTEVKE